MNPISWRNADGGKAGRDRTARRRKVETNLRCESLETRQLLTTRVLNPGMSDWATAATWSPSGVPVNGDTLILPSGAGQVFLQNNNLPTDTQLNLDFEQAGFVVSGNRIALTGPTAIVTNGNNTFGGDTLAIALSLPSGSATAAVNGSAALVLDGIITPGTLTKTGGGVLQIHPLGSYPTLQTIVSAGDFQVEGVTGGVTLSPGTVLLGTGTTGAVNGTGGGTISPGNSPGIINTGTVTLGALSTLNIELNGTTVGAQYDQVNVTGNVALGSATLNVTLGYVPGPTDTFTIVNNDSTDPIQGTFAGLPQGALLTLPNPVGSPTLTTQFKINYFGGDGNDVVLAVNGPPLAGNDFYTLPESSLANPTFLVPAPGVLGNDSDPNGDTIHPVLKTGPIHGTLQLFGDGSFSYSPAPGYVGADSFTYWASDGNLLSNLATVSLNVNAVNEAPVANDDSYSVIGSLPASPTTATIAAPGVLGNDFSTETPPLAITAELVGNATHGVVALAADGSFTYTPAAGYVGVDTFTYRDRDTNLLGSNVATVTLNVGVKEVAPVANPDAFSTYGDKALFVVGPGVLANDTDANPGDTKTAFLVNGPQHGTLTLSGDGSFTYNPDPNFSGTDTFVYRATDGQLVSNDATVTLTVNFTNHAPVAVADSYTTAEEAALTVAANQGVLVNDTDPDNPGAAQTLTAIIINNPQHGTLVADANGDGGFTYTPNALFRGVDTFTYRAADGAGGFSAITPVTITVTPINHAPVATADAFTVNANTVLTVASPGVLTNDSDPDLDPISSVLLTGPSHGTVVLNSDGSFTYTPTQYYSGADSFTYRASDGKLFSAPATVSLTVNFVNSPPVAVADAYTTPEESPLTVSVINGVLANDSDPDPGQTATLTAQVVHAPLHGTVVLATDGSFVYTPNALYRGVDTFTYQAKDALGALSAITAVTITVTPINHAPVAVNDAYAINENTTLTVAGPGVLQNDTDADLDPLSAVVQTGPAHGVVVLNTNGSFTYIPTAYYSGPDSFTYRASDGQALSNIATVSLTVNFVNNVPVSVADNYTTPEEQVLTVGAPGVLANDSDPDPAQTLSAVLVNNPLHGTVALAANGSFVYTPNALFRGTDSFTYQASDGLGGLSPITPVTITVTPVNHAPVAVNDTYSVNENTVLTVSNLGVIQNDTDADGDTLTASMINGPLHGVVVLNSNGSFTYTPTQFYSGPDSFTYRDSDGQAFSNTATVSLTVNFVNSPPVAVADAYTTPEESPLTVTATFGVLANDSDPDPGQTATLTAVLVNAPLHGSVALATDGSFVYTPNALYRGTDSFTYQAKDVNGGLSAITPVTIVVTPINHAPVAVNDAYSVNENSTLTVSGVGVQQNDTDADGDPLKSSIVDGPLHGVAVLNMDGSFTYTPTQFYSGTDTFTYRLFDGKTFSNTATVTLTINFVNTPPTAVADNYTTPEESVLTVPASNGVLANDSDPDPGQTATLTAQVVNQPLHGTLVLSPTGGFTYTPAPLFRGTDSFTYQAKDASGGLSAITPVSIVVTPINHAPTVVDTAFSTNENITLDVNGPGVLYQANDLDGDPLSAVLIDGPFHGVVALQSSGEFVYQPNIYFHGTDTFTYRAFDGKTFSNLGTATITVRFTPTPPTAGNDSYTIPVDQRLVVAAPGILGNDFDIDGLVLTPIVVNSTQNGTLVVNPNGSFVYTPNPQFTGVDSFTYRASDGVTQSMLATVTITVTPRIITTVHLDPNSDTGVSNTDRITNDNHPIFFGTTAPNLKVVLYAQIAGATAPSIVGVSTADSAGNYTIGSIPLADGNYEFFVEAFRADGLSTGRIDAGPLTIDTVAPVVTNVELNPRTGQIYVTYTDNRVGLANSTALDIGNYSFTAKTLPHPRADAITSATLLPGISPTSPETIVLTSAGGRHTKHGRYLFRIISGGVADIAGNALDGEFFGTFPSGNGQPGGDFYGEFLNGGNTRRNPIPFPDFIPVVTAKKVTPAGPVVHAKAHHVKKGR